MRLYSYWWLLGAKHNRGQFAFGVKIGLTFLWRPPQNCVIKIVREKYLNTTAFTDKETLQAFLSELYVFLVDQMHVALNKVLPAEEAPAEPPPVTDSATLKHFAREAEVRGSTAREERASSVVFFSRALCVFSRALWIFSSLLSIFVWVYFHTVRNPGLFSSRFSPWFCIFFWRPVPFSCALSIFFSNSCLFAIPWRREESGCFSSRLTCSLRFCVFFRALSYFSRTLLICLFVFIQTPRGTPFLFFLKRLVSFFSRALSIRSNTCRVCPCSSGFSSTPWRSHALFPTFSSQMPYWAAYVALDSVTSWPMEVLFPICAFSLACGHSRLPSDGCDLKSPRKKVESLSRGFRIATAFTFSVLRTTSQSYRNSWTLCRLWHLKSNTIDIARWFDWVNAAWLSCPPARWTKTLSWQPSTIKR